jgi:hypothetical protein
MKERKHNYVVGFVGEKQVVYGKDRKTELHLNPGSFQWAEPMTLLQARRALKSLVGSGSKVAIYKLIPVE